MVGSGGGCLFTPHSHSKPPTYMFFRGSAVGGNIPFSRM